MTTKYHSPPSQTNCPKPRHGVLWHNVIKLYRRRWWGKKQKCLVCIQCDGVWDL